MVLGGRRRRPKFDSGAFEDIIDGVKSIYREKIRPLEEMYLVKVRRSPSAPELHVTCTPSSEAELWANCVARPNLRAPRTGFPLSSAARLRLRREADGAPMWTVLDR